MDSKRPYRHGNLSAALVAAARQILDEDGLQAVGLRETARRVGVSSTATYRHFTSKDDLLASVAAEGFRELAAAMQSATRGASPLTRAGLAYIEFACQNPGVFRLMFGPVLAQRAKYPASRPRPRASKLCCYAGSPTWTSDHSMTIMPPWPHGAWCTDWRI
jgi:AcrR family transcriptional regulator